MTSARFQAGFTGRVVDPDDLRKQLAEMERSLTRWPDR
jgi:hypothetical protein